MRLETNPVSLGRDQPHLTMVNNTGPVLGGPTGADLGRAQRLLLHDGAAEQLHRGSEVHLHHLREGTQRLRRDHLVCQGSPVWRAGGDVREVSGGWRVKGKAEPPGRSQEHHQAAHLLTSASI